MEQIEQFTEEYPDNAPLGALQAQQQVRLAAVEAAQDQLAAAHRELQRVEEALVQQAQRTKQQPMRQSFPATTTPSTRTAVAVTVILNPAAKALLDARYTQTEIVAALTAVGFAPDIQTTTLEIDAYALAQNAVANGASLVVAAGGDGTIEEVAAALIDSDTTLGILPLGTMNNIALTLGIPFDLEAAAFALAVGAVRRIDIGHVLGPNETAAGAVEGYFLETAGIGLSAIAAPMGEAYEKGRWADVFSKLGEFLAGTATQVTVRCDNETAFYTQTHTLTVSNAPFFGNNMLIAPAAKVDDGLLDLVVYANMELVDLTTYFYAISGGGETHEPRLLTCRARHIQISTDIPLAVNADLDVLEEQQHWEIEVKRRALAVVVGNGPGLTFPLTAKVKVGSI